MTSQEEYPSQQPTVSAVDIARRVQEIQNKRHEAEAKIEELQKEVEKIDQELDQFIQSVVACL
jgi:peptidoglycan hydrolase CwlO-like protein